jgi:hypothetical protein
LAWTVPGPSGCCGPRPRAGTFGPAFAIAGKARQFETKPRKQPAVTSDRASDEVLVIRESGSRCGPDRNPRGYSSVRGDHTLNFSPRLRLNYRLPLSF